MSEGIGIAKRNLIGKIINQNFGDNKKIFNENELLFVIQELLDQEGKKYFEGRTTKRGFEMFRQFTELLLYRNLANFDSMILITSDKGCLAGESLVELPRDLSKYPDGVPIKDLVGKKNFYVYSFNVKTNKLEVKKAKECVLTKTDLVYELELKSGKKIRTTGNHPFLLKDGTYKQLKDLVWFSKKKEDGSLEHNRMMINKKMVYSDRLQMISRTKNDDNYIKIDFNPLKKNNKTIFSSKMIEHRFIAEQILGDIKDKLVHHIDENHNNNNVENLQIVTQKEHYNLHQMQHREFEKGNNYGSANKGVTFKKGQKTIIKNRTPEFNKMCSDKRVAYFKNKDNEEVIDKWRDSLKGKGGKVSNESHSGGVIKSIKLIGKRKVYDIIGVEDNHNFIANKFVVSNSGKSSAAMMIARQWCKLIGIKFNPAKHIAYNNSDMMNKIDNLRRFEPIIADESIRFASAADWARKENKELKKKLAQVRTKHLLYILCFPLKVYKLENSYLQSFTNYWIHLMGRGKGSVFVKDMNPVKDSWRLKAFEKLASFNEFTPMSKIETILKKHPNFWMNVRFPKPPKWLYDKYLKVREHNVYDDDAVMQNVTKEDMHTALLIMALRDIMLHDTALSMSRIVLHIKNEYDISLNKKIINSCVDDAKQLVSKIKEQALQI